MFWPFTVWINCSSDLKNFVNSLPSVSNLKSFSRSIEQFFLSVGQNILVSKYQSYLKTSIDFKIVLFKNPLFSKPSWWNLLEESKKKYTSQNVFYKRFSLTRAMRRVSRVPSNQDQWCQPSTNSQHQVERISQGGFLVSFTTGAAAF